MRCDNLKNQSLGYCSSKIKVPFWVKRIILALKKSNVVNNFKNTFKLNFNADENENETQIDELNPCDSEYHSF